MIEANVEKLKKDGELSLIWKVRGDSPSAELLTPRKSRKAGVSPFPKPAYRKRAKFTMMPLMNF